MHQRMVGLIPEIADAWKRYYDYAIRGGCDEQQAVSIADQRSVTILMKRDAVVFERRNHFLNQGGKETPKEKQTRVTAEVTTEQPT